jgi:RNA polymerase sigma-70 factor (ECF subfamily)
VVLAAGRSDSPQAIEALEKLCRVYWYPLYAYVRRRGHDAHDAEDLTQEFFARLLDSNSLSNIQREGGKFRSFLLTALKRFLANDWERQQTQKRGAGQRVISLDEMDPEARYRVELADPASPDVLFERSWATTVLEQVLTRLGAEYAGERKFELFERLQPCLTGAESLITYSQLASELNLTEAAVKMSVHRLRRRYGELLRLEIAQTVVNPSEIEEEIRALLAAAK